MGVHWVPGREGVCAEELGSGCPLGVRFQPCVMKVGQEKVKTGLVSQRVCAVGEPPACEELREVRTTGGVRR